MKNKISAAVLMTVLFFSVPVQPVLAEVPEEWRYDEDMFEYYWEDKEKEEADKKQQEMYDKLAEKREWQANQQMEKEAEKEKKNAAYDGSYVDFDDEYRYLENYTEHLLGDIYDEGDIISYDEEDDSKVIITPPYKTDSKLKKLLKECKRSSKKFKYSISNKKNTITMTRENYIRLTGFMFEKIQAAADKLIGIEQNGIFKDFEFDADEYALTVYVTDQFESEYSYTNTLFENKAKDILYLLRTYGVLHGAESDDLDISILDIYTEESYFSNM